MNIDLDAARAARQAARDLKKEDRTLVFGGVSFELPAELPLSAAEAMQVGEFRIAMAELLDDQAEAFFAQHPTLVDLEALVQGADLPDGTHMPGLVEMYVNGVSANG